jgi:hypothetical protein
LFWYSITALAEVANAAMAAVQSKVPIRRISPSPFAPAALALHGGSLSFAGGN